MQKSDIFYRFGNDQILPKNVAKVASLQKLKTTFKNHFIWFMWKTYDSYENIKIKL